MERCFCQRAQCHTRPRCLWNRPGKARDPREVVLASYLYKNGSTVSMETDISTTGAVDRFEYHSVELRREILQRPKWKARMNPCFCTETCTTWMVLRPAATYSKNAVGALGVRDLACSNGASCVHKCQSCFQRKSWFYESEFWRRTESCRAW